MRDLINPRRASAIAHIVRLAGSFIACSFIAGSFIAGSSIAGGCKSESKPAPQAAPTADLAAAPATDPTARPVRKRRDLHGPTTPFGDRPLLDRFDSDGNGRLDETERAAVGEARLESIFARLDTNGDGSVSPTEAQGAGRRIERAMKRWDEIDLDKSGGLSRDELGAALERRRPKAANPTPPPR